MRIVIDLQAAQGENRKRGIGRYSLDLTHAILRNRGAHEIILVLSDLFPDAVQDLRATFRGILPRDNIRVWSAPGPVRASDPENPSRAARANAIRETFIETLEPDVVLVTSLFEGLGDDAVTSVNADSRARTAVILYDLIPLAMSDVYLKNEDRRAWYMDKIEHLKSADVLMSISAAAGQDAVDMLGSEPERVVNIMGDANSMFRPVVVPDSVEADLRHRLGIRDRFLMYTGGIDHRKNIDGLIKAFAELPCARNSDVQLVIVCHAEQSARDKIAKITRQSGLPPNSVIVTGYISDGDLLNLYNICTAFVFPSLMEGFGLPALEAMRCGVPVIASNTSSLPEVVGREDALFDPTDIASMAAKMDEVLFDEDFRKSLVQHGLEQAKSFSWDKSAKIALAAIEQLGPRRVAVPSLPETRKRLAYVSPLPPEKSGISDYSAELLPALAEHYNIDVVVDQREVTDPWIKENLTIRDASWFAQHHRDYDRILYHFGNSQFHRHMFSLISETSGVAVLHDFFLSGARALLMPETWQRNLFFSHGYRAIAASAAAEEPNHAIWHYPTNLDILQIALGTVVHSDYAKIIASRYYGPSVNLHIDIVPQLRAPVKRPRKSPADAKASLKISENSILISSFGFLGSPKLNMPLLEAFLDSKLAQDPMVHLIFVGTNDGGDYGKSLTRKIASSGIGHRIQITGWLESDKLKNYFDATDIAVQIRGQSRGETSRAVLDCMAHGIPTIVNANGSMSELDPSTVRMIPDLFEQIDLTDALEEIVANHKLRERLGTRARCVIGTQHNPKNCAETFRNVIEATYAGPKAQIDNLVANFAKGDLPNSHAVPLSKSLASTFVAQPRRRALFVDLSIIAARDDETGIQRVIKSIVSEFLDPGNPALDIIPVRRRADDRYVVAQGFMSDVFNLECGLPYESLIDFGLGDVFLALDLDLACPSGALVERRRMQRHGVHICTVVYDLLPVKLPSFFEAQAHGLYSNWLDRVLSGDGALCISRTVADELRDWIAEHRPDRLDAFVIKHFHLGADIQNSVPSKGMPDDAEAILASIAERPGFLSVGTIEPRKGIRQTLDAFELLWGRGIDVSLVIVGKQGWMVDDLAKRLTKHPEKRQRLFWLAGISDEFLEKIYDASTCLIAASEGEGFGLPLIEAAQHQLPIIARDLPVFEEVATTHATYFSGTAPQELASVIENWLETWRNKRHIRSDNMPWITWRESAIQVLQALGLDYMASDTRESNVAKKE